MSWQDLQLIHFGFVRLYQPKVCPPCTPTLTLFLTSISIVKGGLVDKAILIDMTGQSVWGKSAGIEVKLRFMGMKRLRSVGLTWLRFASFLPLKWPRSLLPSTTHPRHSNTASLSEETSTSSTRSMSSITFLCCTAPRYDLNSVKCSCRRRQYANLELYPFQGKEGIIAARCSQSILVSHYPDTAPPGKSIDFVQNQAKHLIANNL